MLDEGRPPWPLLEACRAAAAPLGPYEICVTNDGSRDDTGAALERFAAAHPDLPVTIVTHARPAGQSAAVHDAVRAARAPLICTLDGDGQNPPEEIPNLLAPLLADAASPRLALVAGQRAKRNDPLAKRLASRAANAIRGWLLARRDAGHWLRAQGVPPRRLSRATLFQPHAPLPPRAIPARRLGGRPCGRDPPPARGGSVEIHQSRPRHRGAQRPVRRGVADPPPPALAPDETTISTHGRAERPS
jgi:hypothetical protein